MNQANLSAALVIGQAVRVMLKDSRTLQGILVESHLGTNGEPCHLKFRSALNLEPKSHFFASPEEVISVEILPAPAGLARR